MTSRADDEGCCCCCSSIPLRLGFILVVIAFLTSLVALGTPMWFEFTYSEGTKNEGYQGLWNHCYFDDDFACCGTVFRFFESRNTTAPVWLQAVRICMSASTFFSLVCLILVNCVTKDNASKRLAISSIIVTNLTGLLHVATCIVYAVFVRDITWSNRVTYSVSFILAFTAGGCLIVTSLLILFTICCMKVRKEKVELNTPS